MSLSEADCKTVTRSHLGFLTSTYKEIARSWIKSKSLYSWSMIIILKIMNLGMHPSSHNIWQEIVFRSINIYIMIMTEV